MNPTTGSNNFTEDDNYFSDYDLAQPCDLKVSKVLEVTIQTYIYSVICVFGLLGNILVILTYVHYKKAKSLTDVYLVNVAMADLVFVIALPLIIYNERYDWTMGSFICKLLRGAYSINLFSSTLLLACISGDRYVAIVQAKRSFGVRSRALVYSRLICLMVWLLAIGLSVPTFMYYDLIVEDEQDQAAECNFKFDDIDTAKRIKILLPSTQVSIGFFLPLLVMGFCYLCVLFTLLRTHNSQRHKAVRVVLAVFFVFVACHLPYNVALLFHTIGLFKERGCSSENTLLLTISITRSVAYLHCCLNPILYAFIGVKFRKHFVKIFEDLWCQGKKFIYSGRSSRQTSELYIPAPYKSNDGPKPDNPSSFTM
ncbi:C-C chemokine receptor type 6 [Denticeps clupeoides]|uniref:G-protein coupled receptors family 1 profile domain-containing protein n=1 Tax=Denticeps clupeoides TaxID=299321 RepID=A0AAY4DQY2_9TELE|nr:C-C chemokine receptor type 6-like [Denticeps clupeoides]